MLGKWSFPFGKDGLCSKILLLVSGMARGVIQPLQVGCDNLSGSNPIYKDNSTWNLSGPTLCKSENRFSSQSNEHLPNVLWNQLGDFSHSQTRNTSKTEIHAWFSCLEKPSKCLRSLHMFFWKKKHHPISSSSPPATKQQVVLQVKFQPKKKLLYFEWSPPWHVGWRLSGEGYH